MTEDRTNFRPKAGDKVKTRNGRTGVILSHQIEGDYALVAEIKNKNDGYVVRCYSYHGVYDIHTNSKDLADLMPPEPEKTYRPWTNKEVLKFAKKDGWLRKKSEPNVTDQNICTIHSGHVKLAYTGGVHSFSDLLENYKKTDGSPCGVEITEEISMVE